MTNLLPWLTVFIGFVGLLWSAGRFVDGSAAIANNFGVPKLLIGLTVVAFGTSAPEIMVSISASLKGNGDIAIGNALGSNLANVGLVLGTTMLIAPITIKACILKQETLVMLAVMGVGGWLLYDSQLHRIEGIFLVSLVIPFMIWLVYYKSGSEEETLQQMETWLACLWFIVGLVVLMISAELLVSGATDIALALGVSPLVIGLTIIAIGTSLPELATSVFSALKGHHDMAVGNIIGSNILNVLLVVGIPAIIQPLHMIEDVFYRDYLSMLGISLVLCITMLWSVWKSKGVLGRLTGGLLLALYVGYYLFLL